MRIGAREFLIIDLENNLGPFEEPIGVTGWFWSEELDCMVHLNVNYALIFLKSDNATLTSCLGATYAASGRMVYVATEELPQLYI